MTYPSVWSEVAEVDEDIPIGNGRVHRRRAGEALHPEHEPLEVLEKVRREVGPDIFAAQYQQSPVPPGGALFKREWLRYYDRPPERTSRNKIIQSWDTASKDGVHNDYSVCTTWLVREGKFYLLDLVRSRFDYPRLRASAIALAQRFKPSTILIEDASTGTALAQELRKQAVWGIELVKVEHDKITRAYVQQAKFEHGLVLFPKNAPFLRELETELLAFPQGRTDDQVDSITQALAYRPKYNYNVTLEGVL